MVDTDNYSSGLISFEQKDKVKIFETTKGKLHFELSMITLDVKLIEAKIKELQDMCNRNEQEK